MDATIWSFRKRTLDYRVYVTDDKGKVVFATDPGEIGKDYSRWRDVALTLQGRYGARTSRDDPQNENSSVMHVAAPIHAGVRIIGVLTVAKPNATVQPFIERSQTKIRNRGFLLLAAAAAIGVLFTWRLTRSVNRLRRYARDVTEGRRVPPPESGASEIAELGRALEAMREKLEGKQYVEQYVQTLTHELKSPVAATSAARRNCWTRRCRRTSAAASSPTSANRQTGSARWASACWAWRWWNSARRWSGSSASKSARCWNRCGKGSPRASPPAV